MTALLTTAKDVIHQSQYWQYDGKSIIKIFEIVA